MSQGVLIAEEQTVLQTAEPALVGTLSDSKVKSKAAKLTYRIIKRSFDLLFGLFGAFFILPLALFIKLAYVLTGDFGSIFFVQKRIGLHGREFNFYKFRTMVKDADLKLVELLDNKSYAAEWQKYRKLKNDPRISKVGKFLRKTSLDEFPQFLNVLKGDMSIVGNRPFLPREKDDIADHIYENLISIKPGITGYWQVSGRSNIGFDDRIQLENFYAENASLGFDLAIFFRTFRAVASTSGAD
ncbi:sugar transferase [Candidatus Saccharibacteria bacterium]|nr:sugar transferase [Candidatus Saccharibacteria bacterium]